MQGDQGVDQDVDHDGCNVGSSSQTTVVDP